MWVKPIASDTIPINFPELLPIASDSLVFRSVIVTSLNSPRLRNLQTYDFIDSAITKKRSLNQSKFARSPPKPKGSVQFIRAPSGSREFLRIDRKRWGIIGNHHELPGLSMNLIGIAWDLQGIDWNSYKWLWILMTSLEPLSFNEICLLWHLCYALVWCNSRFPLKLDLRKRKRRMHVYNTPGLLKTILNEPAHISSCSTSKNLSKIIVC